jgi:hypothetical protein
MAGRSVVWQQHCDQDVHTVSTIPALGVAGPSELRETKFSAGKGTHMTLAKYIGLGALAVAAAACTPKPPPPPAAAAAMQQLPPGRIYTFHSSAQAGCPGLDWHVVLTPDNMLDGMVAWNNWQSMAHATGSINPQARTFQMTAEELGGRHRTADISGTVRSDGYLVANVTGPNVSCQGIMVGWSAPPPPNQ